MSAELRTTCCDCYELFTPAWFGGYPSVRCGMCAVKLMLRTTTLDKVAKHHCAVLIADGEAADFATVHTAMSYAIAMTLAYPEWAAAALAEQECINGQPLSEVIELMADGMAGRFPVSVVQQ